MAGGDPAGLAARTTALEVVSLCLAGEYLAPALRKVLDASSLAGADRSLVADLSYGTVRRLLQLDAALAPYLKEPERLPPRVLSALRIAAYELLFRGTASYAAVSAWVELVKREARGLAGLANAVLRRVARAADRAEGSDGGAGRDRSEVSQGADGPPSQAGLTEPDDEAAPFDPERDLSLPRWLWQAFATSLGEHAASRAALGMLEPEPLWLTSFSERAVDVLEAQGCEVGSGPWQLSSLGVRSLRVRSPVPLDRLDAYRTGLVQPQNPSSLYAALLLGALDDAKPVSGQVLFDLASGQGVKTAVLAAVLGTDAAEATEATEATEANKATEAAEATEATGPESAATGARIVAVERSAKRTRAAQANLRRLGFAGGDSQGGSQGESRGDSQGGSDVVEHVVADLVTTPAEDLLAVSGGPAARVLLDAPCSGTGTLRGHPEIKLRLNPDDVSSLAATQAAMLDTAAELVAPGGVLLYAVCSLTPAEGPEQIASFLARHDEFAPVGFSPPLPHAAGAHGSFVLPEAGLDGFYLSLLRRN